MDSLEALQGLHRDLVILTESRLPNIQRLSEELDAHLEEFRTLLSKPPRKEESRKILQSGTVEIDEEKYSLNDDFKNAALQIADEIDIDEIQAAKLFFHAQDEARAIERSPSVVTLLRFHRHRQILLDCLRILIHESVKDNEDEDEQIEDLRGRLADVVKLITGSILLITASQDGTMTNGSAYWRKCLGFMGDIEAWLQKLSDQLQRFSVTGQSLSHELSELIKFQQQSLMAQHESLAAIASHLIKGGYTTPDDLRFLLRRTQRIDKYDRILVHYSSVLAVAIAHFGAADEVCSIEDARSINGLITSNNEADQWGLRNFHASVITWWLAEYSSRFSEFSDPPAQLPDGVDAKKERDSQHSQFMTALNDGGFHFTLTMAQDTSRSEWRDPAKDGFVAFLLNEAHLPSSEFEAPADYTRDILFRGLQIFTEAFITNMPTTIRQLRLTEDVSRKSMRSRFQRSNQDSELHLERFLIIASYAYQGDSLSATPFWTDTESNLYGFLQWAARRQTTPRVAAFCELVRALSEDEASADAVHRFLLDEGQPVAGRFRRTGSLSWSQIISELQFYASITREKLAPPQSGIYSSQRNMAEELVEPESSMMLESYLRLVSHVCARSPAARAWVLTNSDVQLHELLFQLCSNEMSESRLKACAFTALNALCTDKSSDTFVRLWSALDQWIYGTSSVPATSLGKGLVRHDSGPSIEQQRFTLLGIGFEEPYAFINLLRSLVAPLESDGDLNDQLPFPENLGSTYRMPGVEPYVDFVMGRVFGEKIARLDDPLQVRMLRLSCLGFVTLCLATFNEDLVTIANRSNFAVDSVIATSSLSAYVLLHPFARVMEWMFNDKVVQALFAAAHQEVQDVNDAAPDSPLVQSLIMSIEAITLVMRLQSTYLDIVRPLVKTHATDHRMLVANAALASFEDAVLNNLQIVVDLGLYCGTGHQDLALASLQLLQVLSSSRKLVSSTTPSGFGYRSDRSKVIAILERDNDADRIARTLIPELQVDSRELEAGPDAPGYIIKRRILEFIHACLTSLRDRPSISHMLLGFNCKGNALGVSDDGLFSEGKSLFHAVLRLAIDYPDSDGRGFVYWTGLIKSLCIEILHSLWTSPLTSALVLAELRESEYLFIQAITQKVISSETLWNGRTFFDAETIVTDSLPAYRNFLRQRTAHFEFVARALRSVSLSGMPTLRHRIESTILGSTTFDGGQTMRNPSIFDLFDFMELDLGRAPVPPTLNILGEFDFGICRKDPANPASSFNLDGVEELLLLRLAERKKSGQLPTTESAAKADEEKRQALYYILALNQYQETLQAHREALNKWVQLLTVALECCKFEQASKTTVILTALQVISPKFERSLGEDSFTAMELATLALALLRHLDASSEGVAVGKASDFAKDRLHQLFRVSLASVVNHDATPEFRNVNYQICYRYLRIVNKQSEKKSALAKNVLRAVSIMGEKLLDLFCDDAASGPSDCRVSAIFVLDALVELANKEKSKYMLEAFSHINFVGVLVDNIKNIADDLRSASVVDVPMLLAYYNAMLALLLRIAKTKSGAAFIFNSGLFPSIRDSLLFSIDPDIGLDFETEEARKKFFDLMLAVLRVINAVVLSRGQQHEQTLKQARDFLVDCRLSMVGIFKRNAKIGLGKGDNGEDLSDLVDNFTLLIVASDFLAYEDEASILRSPPSIFS